MPACREMKSFFRANNLTVPPEAPPLDQGSGEWSALRAVDTGAHPVTFIGLDRGRAAGESREQDDGTKH